MVVGQYNITIVQGSDKDITMTLKEDNGDLIDLSTYSARMQVRPTKTAQIIYDDLSTDNDRIEIDTTDSKVILKFPNTITSAYDFKTAFYDLELYVGTDPIIVKRLLEGTFNVNKEVTRQ